MPSDAFMAIEFAQSKGQARQEGKTGVKFEDVAGMDQTLRELRDIVEVRASDCTTSHHFWRFFWPLTLHVLYSSSKVRPGIWHWAQSRQRESCWRESLGQARRWWPRPSLGRQVFPSTR